MSLPHLRQSLSPAKPRLLDQVRTVARRKHYSIHTEQTYIDWIKRYIFFHNKRHPLEMGAAELEQFLNHLAVNKNVSGFDAKPGPERPDIVLSVR